ncbi:hypothetical protein ACFW7P_31615 [Streptomyces albidoflavus]|jgi:hypothetical protein
MAKLADDLPHVQAAVDGPLVLTVPQDGVPLLFIEVDNCHETAEKLAAKLEKCARFFRRTSKDTDGKERPM